MNLVAVNNLWAVYEVDMAPESTFDALSALNDLISMRTTKDLLNFLDVHACRESFVCASERYLWRDWSNKMKCWGDDEPQVLGLSGSLDNALLKHPDVDYLDELTASDLDSEKTFDLSLMELMEVRDTLGRFLVAAAVAIGDRPPEGFFEEVATRSVFDDAWWECSVGTDISQSRTFLLDLEKVGVKRRGLFDPWFFDDSIFYQEVKWGRCPDGPNVGCAGHVILSAPEYLEDGETSPYTVSVTSARCDREGVRQALELCAGKVVEIILNNRRNLYECSLSIPHTVDEHTFEEYSFVLGKGFRRNSDEDVDVWFDLLLDEAIAAILDGRVKVCPECGSPVISRDRRGRFGKEFCSNRCKTSSSKSRRDEAMRCAASGVPIDEAISRIGERYRNSIEKWYAEVFS